MSDERCAHCGKVMDLSIGFEGAGVKTKPICLACLKALRVGPGGRVVNPRAKSSPPQHAGASAKTRRIKRTGRARRMVGRSSPLNQEGFEMGRKRKAYDGAVDGKSAAAGESATAVLEPENVAGEGKAPEIQDLATGEVMDDAACREKLLAILRKREEIEQAEAELTGLKEICSEAGKAVGEQKTVVTGLRRDLADIEAGQKLLFD